MCLLLNENRVPLKGCFCVENTHKIFVYMHMGLSVLVENTLKKTHQTSTLRPMCAYTETLTCIHTSILLHAYTCLLSYMHKRFYSLTCIHTSNFLHAYTRLLCFMHTHIYSLSCIHMSTLLCGYKRLLFYMHTHVHSCMHSLCYCLMH